MQDRFKFNAVVSSYYDIDTPTNYEEHEPQFYLSDVDVFCNQEIGIDYDVLFDTVKQQVKNLSEKEIGQIMQHFEDNSNSPECDFVTIRPDKILQCTGLKDKNGKLIYEGDVLDLYVSSKKLYRYEVKYEIGSFMLVSQDEIFDFPHVWNDYVYPLSQLYYEYQNEENCIDECEVIGNIYENPELLEDK